MGFGLGDIVEYKNKDDLRHKGTYKVIMMCRAKNPTNGLWFDAMIYMDVLSELMYVREYNDFLNKFKEKK